MKIFEIEIFQLWVQYGSIQYFFLRLVCILGRPALKHNWCYFRKVTSSRSLKGTIFLYRDFGGS